MIRKMEERDRDLFLRLSAEFYDSPAVLHPVPKSYHADAFEEMMRGEQYALGYILEMEGVAVGYGMASVSYSREAGGKVLWLEELYIEPDCRGRGLGKEFFAAAERYAAEHGFARIRLEVEPRNVRARSLYERLGYRPLDYLQMCKELRAE